MLYWISYPLKGIHWASSPEDRKHFHWSLFCWAFFSFIRAAAIRQRKLFQDTRALKICICWKCCAWTKHCTSQYCTAPQRSEGIFLNDISKSCVHFYVGKMPRAACLWEKSPGDFRAVFWLWNAGLWLSTSPSETRASQERCHVQTPVWGRITYGALILNVKDRQLNFCLCAHKSSCLNTLSSGNDEIHYFIYN